MTLTARPHPELDPRAPGPAVHHVDPLLSFPPFTLAHISLCTFCCPCIYTLSYPSLALSSSPPRRSFIPRFICSPSPPLCSLFYASHTFPAHPSLMLIYVAGYSWVNTIFARAKQAPEAAFIYQNIFPLFVWHVFGLFIDVFPFLLCPEQLTVVTVFFFSLSFIHRSGAITRMSQKFNEDCCKNVLECKISINL